MPGWPGAGLSAWGPGLWGQQTDWGLLEGGAVPELHSVEDPEIQSRVSRKHAWWKCEEAQRTVTPARVIASWDVCRQEGRKADSSVTMTNCRCLTRLQAVVF